METSLNLNKAMLGEIIERIERGEIGYCRQLGFAEEELSAIENLSQRELNKLGKSPVTFVNATINHHVLWSLIHNVREDSKQRQIIDKALMLGASSDLLREMFSLSSAEVASRRKMLGIKESMGRKPNADEATETAIWLMWEQYCVGLSPEERDLTDNISDNAFEVLMLISEEKAVSLAEVVRLVRAGERQRLGK